MAKVVPADIIDTVYIVIKEYPNIYMEIEKVFVNIDNAHDYITDTYPYFVYYAEKDIYAMADLEDEELENEERYYIMERPLAD